MSRKTATRRKPAARRVQFRLTCGADASDIGPPEADEGGQIEEDPP